MLVGCPRRSRGSILAAVVLVSLMGSFSLFLKRTAPECPPAVVGNSHVHEDEDTAADTTIVIRPTVSVAKGQRGYEVYEGAKPETMIDQWAGGHGSAKIYCLVPFVWIPSKKDRHSEIMRTWGKRCDGINFFVDNTHLDATMSMPDNVVVINMTRKSVWGDQSQKHIWEKMWRSWIWVAENKLTQYDWFLKVDDDNFFFPDNVRRFVRLKKWRPTDAHYFGHKLYHRQVPIIAGAMVAFSRGTLGQLAMVYRAMPKGGITDERGKCEDRKGATEELSTAICLYEAGIHAEDTRDSGREPILIFQPAAHFLHMPRPPEGDPAEGWYWQHKPRDAGDLSDCCSRYPFAFHGFKGHGNLDTLDQGFYGDHGVEKLFPWLAEGNDGMKSFLREINTNLKETSQGLGKS